MPARGVGKGRKRGSEGERKRERERKLGNPEHFTLTTARDTHALQNETINSGTYNREEVGNELRQGGHRLTKDPHKQQSPIFSPPRQQCPLYLLPQCHTHLLCLPFLPPLPLPVPSPASPLTLPHANSAHPAHCRKPRHQSRPQSAGCSSLGGGVGVGAWEKGEGAG